MFSLPLFFIITGTSILNQLDIIFLKTRLSTELSGMYGYLNNFGKIFYFGSFLFIGAMAPQITESFNKRENYFKIFLFYFKIVFSTVSLGLIVLIFFAKEFLDLFIFFSAYIGLKQSSLANFYAILEYIPLYSIFISVYVFVNFLVIFLIAVSAFRIYIAFLLAVLMQGLLIFVFANDIYTAIYCNLFVSSLLLIYLIYEIYKKYISFNNSSNL
jgi:O-antigen/teichoic acid export membrane protein